MTSHVDSVAWRARALANRDREAIREGSPILAPQCLDSLVRLQAYLREIQASDRDGLFRGRPLAWLQEYVDRDGLLEAATQVLECVQNELHARRGAPLDYLVAKELAFSRKVALDVLVLLRDNQYAKEVQARVAPGPPLTVCVGRPYPHRFQTMIGEDARALRVTVLGCLRVFDDAPTKGKMWPFFCPECRSGKRKPARGAERAMKRRVTEYLRAASGQ